MNNELPFDSGTSAVLMPTTNDQGNGQTAMNLRPISQVAEPITNPMQLLAMVIANGGDLSMVKELMDLRRTWEADEARKAFNRAFSGFKSEAVRIVKNIDVKDGPLKGKKYADLFAVVNSATDALSKHGLSSSWRLTKDDPTWIEVTCTLRHEMGHSESVFMGGPPDNGGAKNAIQARASSLSYLERYTFLAITGLASSDGDTDGRTTVAAGSDLQTDLDKIAATTTLKDLQEIYTTAYRKATAANNKSAQGALLNAKNERKADLQKEKK